MTEYHFDISYYNQLNTGNEKIMLFIELFEKTIQSKDYEYITENSHIDNYVPSNSNILLEKIFLNDYLEFVGIYNHILKMNLLKSNSFVYEDKYTFSNDFRENLGHIEKEIKSLLNNIDIVYAHNKLYYTPTKTDYLNKDKYKKDIWYNYALKWYDTINVYTKNVCPVLFDIINKYSDIKAAFISILEPMSKLETHCGQSAAVIRYLFPVNMPQITDNCYLVVNGQRINWEKNKPIIFDDTVEHSSVNNTNEYRAVIALDVIRKFDNDDLNTMNNLFIYLSKYFKYNMEINSKINSYNKYISENIR